MSGLYFDRDKMDQELLPKAFAERMRCLLGDEYEALERALGDVPPVSLRVNRKKEVGEAIAAAEGGVPWCATGRYLTERPAFTLDPRLHAGAYYVQEAASMFIEQAVRQYVAEPAVVLDLCAAPGGKSTHLLDALPAGSLLVSNEVIRSRCRALCENLAKWGAVNGVVTNSDPKEFGRAVHCFDVIVADVPCSGEGMFRKAPAARAEWSPEAVRLCAARGRRIVHDVWPALRPGGLLVYCTCTFNTEENEANLRYFAEALGAEALPVEAPEEWGVGGALVGGLPISRFFPHRTRGEGFCLAVMRKPDESTRPVNRRMRRRRAPRPVPEQVKAWIASPGDYAFEMVGDAGVRAVPRVFGEVLATLEEQVQVIAAGVAVGEVKGRDVVPAAALALSTALRGEAFPRVELPREGALRYLRREAMVLPEDVPRGYAIAAYRGLPLGFVKQLGARANNLFPDAWRIRTEWKMGS